MNTSTIKRPLLLGSNSNKIRPLKIQRQNIYVSKEFKSRVYFLNKIMQKPQYLKLKWEQVKELDEVIALELFNLGIYYEDKEIMDLFAEFNKAAKNMKVI